MTRRKLSVPKWTPFESCDMDDYNAKMRAMNDPSPTPDAIWRNSRYTVIVKDCGGNFDGRPMTHLSIKRNDRREIHDWRDIQRIKTEIMGAETEAVELYPAESRLMDEANQYHLWCFPPGFRLPIGYQDERWVKPPDHPNGENDNGSRQRPFEDDDKC